MNLYNQIAWWDAAVHGYTIFAITFLLGLLMYGPVLTGARANPLLVIFTVAAVGIGTGALWEVAEWAYHHWFAQNNAGQGKTDLIVDLILGALGALLAGWATQLSLERER